MAEIAAAEKTRIKTKIHNLINKSEPLTEMFEAVDFTLKNPKKALPILSFAFKRLFNRKKYVFIFATPTHGNRGDQIIVYAMKKWCEYYLPETVCIEFDDSILDDWFKLSLLKAAVKKRDFIFLRGGGSVGDWYIYYEYFVRQILKRYTKNKIVMFPQSVNFSNTPNGQEEKIKTKQAYDIHPDFTLYTRDEDSFVIATEMFTHAKVRLCPDIAMFLFNTYRPKQQERFGILFCLRPDVNETYYGEQERTKMIEAVKELYPVQFGDTSAGHTITIDSREKEIEELLSLFSKSSVAVTDRYHGIISAVLTGTPCIALRSADHKIVSGINWFEDVDFVFYAESIEDVPLLVEKAMQCRDIKIPDFSQYFDKFFEDIING
ncbi:MAG: polysaccharide pyruvyl transferase family protein [Eubacteriales bacterium]